MRVTLSDTRSLVGTLMAFDKHLNVVLGDTEEFRRAREEGAPAQKRSLGLVLLRGGTVVSISAEAPPAPKSRAQQAAERAAAGGPGVARPAGRGVPLGRGGAGLQAPVRGVGGPGRGMMAPAPPSHYAAPPVAAYGRGGPHPAQPYGRGAPPAAAPYMPPPPPPPAPYGRGVPMPPPPPPPPQ